METLGLYPTPTLTYETRHSEVRPEICFYQVLLVILFTLGII